MTPVRAIWKVMNLDSDIATTLQLVLDGSDPETIRVVEYAAKEWGITLVRQVIVPDFVAHMFAEDDFDSADDQPAYRSNWTPDEEP